MLRRSELTKNSSENEVKNRDLNAEKNKRELGLFDKVNSPILSRSDSSLSIKDKNSSELKVQPSNDKLSLTPVKRQPTQLEEPEAKKHFTISPIKRNREKDVEAEWEPEGLDLDFGVFDNTIDESVYERETQDTSIEDLLRRVQESETSIENEFPDTVEYGPPKEKEQPFVPKEEVCVDVFDCWADLDAYELCHLFQEEVEFSLIVTCEDFGQLPTVIINADELEFSHKLSFIEDFDVTEESLKVPDDDYNPFFDHKFDIQHFVESN